MSVPEPDWSWLAALVAPVTADEFMQSYWSAKPLFCRGAPRRFAELLTWDELNDILEHHWRETYRFRLAFQGRDIDPTAYADLAGYTPRIRAKDVTDYLRGGATLSFDAIDELHSPLTRLAESFEAFFRSATKINIYAGWRAQHGLDLHRDNQEIFILQLDGPKRWLLYGFSIDGIDPSALRTHSSPPAGSTLDQVLEPGDLLYIPRGCYHVAVPMNVPTLHLTIGVKVPTAADLLRWIAQRPHPFANRDIPATADAASRERFSDELRTAIRAGLEADLIAQYLRETGSNCKPRPSFSLPHSATAAGLPCGSDFRIRLNAPAPQLLLDDGDAATMTWQSGGRTCRLPKGMRPILEQLTASGSMPFAALATALAADLDEPSLRFLLAMLVSQNLVTIRQT